MGGTARGRQALGCRPIRAARTSRGGASLEAVALAAAAANSPIANGRAFANETGEVDCNAQETADANQAVAQKRGPLVVDS